MNESTESTPFADALRTLADTIDEMTFNDDHNIDLHDAMTQPLMMIRFDDDSHSLADIMTDLLDKLTDL